MNTNTELMYRTGLGEADYARAVGLCNASHEHDGIDWSFSEASIREIWPRMDNIELERDMMRVETTDGELVALARCNWNTQEDGTRVHRHRVHMHPLWRRKGIGTRLLRWMEQRTREKDALQPTTAKRVIHHDGPDTNVGLARLMENNGYMPVRYGYIMVNDDLEHAPLFDLPDGFEVRPVTRGHMREIWQAGNDAFADHWGATKPTEAGFERWSNDPLVRPELFTVAYHVQTNQVAAIVQGFLNETENAQYNRKRGWTEDISTRKQFRRLGLARALITRSIRMFRDMGMTETALGVDTENLTGALRVYEACGYRAVKRDVTWETTLADD